MPWATSLAISTSKPSMAPVSGFFSPKRGWSNLVPTVILPAAWRRAIVVPAAKVGPGVGLAEVVVFLEQPAAATSPTASSGTASKRIRGARILCLLLGGCLLVGQDLGKEVPGALGGRRREEGVGAGGLADPPPVHDDHPPRSGAGEPHLVGDHDHGGAF